jgi:ribonuclease III
VNAMCDDAQLLAWAEARLGHRFANAALLDQALTHTSVGARNYQRLEFLGDRVLGVVIADLLYRSYPEDVEGKLSRRLADLVRLQACADVARSLDVGAWVRLERSAAQAGLANHESVLGDACEALIGALYLDGGLEVARRFIEDAWASLIATMAPAVKDPKSSLQEWAQGRGLKLPVYDLVERSGPDHAPHFVISVTVEGRPPAQGQGASKQEAQKQAAMALLAQLESAK